MATLVIATRAALLIARHRSQPHVEVHLRGKVPTSLAADPNDPTRLYCGTSGSGAWRTTDGGQNWQPAGPGISSAEIMAIAVASTEGSNGPGAVYAGTEPSAVFRSDDGGDTWAELAGLCDLPSAPTWSFPPRPHTHHVRWIEADATVGSRLFVAIEAGALVRTADGGRTWTDRVEGGPYDTHTAATHGMAPGRIYSAAGDGYFESVDAGESWTSPEDGLKHLYLVGLAVDPADPDTVLVSATDGPYVAYRPRGAEAYVYRRTRSGRWELAMEGLPEPRGTTASRFAAHAAEPHVVYAANNRGVFRSGDAGRTWKLLDFPWPQPGLSEGVDAIMCVAE